MMKISIRFIVLATAVFSLLITTYGMHSKSVEAKEGIDPVEVSPETYKVILDNDYIRVLEITPSTANFQDAIACTAPH